MSKKEYIKEQKDHLSLIGSSITPMRPGIGFYITVDGLEVSEEFFPDEYKEILEAWHSVVGKIKKHG